ncbi:ATP:cob(I)alamin adenosyltransferase [Mycoplasmatota bacterium WC30]
MYIKKVNQVATKNGDKGISKDYSNISYKKNDILFETLGSIDELNSFLGLSYHYTKCEELIFIQKELQKISAIIATNPESELYKKIELLNTENITWVEEKMQLALDNHPIEARFTLPGSEKSLNGAYLDYARTLARKAERRLTEFAEKHNRKDLNTIKSYINRLSDYLYVLSCNL